MLQFIEMLKQISEDVEVTIWAASDRSTGTNYF
jgi:hypothetical protein